jgi:hypothetical protein
MSVKLFNFVDSIHRNEAIEDEQLKEEYYNFGLVSCAYSGCVFCFLKAYIGSVCFDFFLKLIFLVTKWQPIDKLTCDNVKASFKHSLLVIFFRKVLH